MDERDYKAMNKKLQEEIKREKSKYQKLFDYLSENHGVDLHVSALTEICGIVNDMQNKAIPKQNYKHSHKKRLSSNA